MIRKTTAPIHYIPTPAAVARFGQDLPQVACAAFLEIGRLARGYAIHHHQFYVRGRGLVAVASHVKPSGVVEIEIDVGNPALPAHTFTAAEAAGAWRGRR